MTAAKIMDIISRLPSCDGQAADAVSAYTQVKMEDPHKLLKIPKSECRDIGIRLPRHKWPKSCSSMEDPVVPLERNLYGHPLAGLLWERQFEKVLLKHGWEKISNCECLFVHREKGLFLSVYVVWEILVSNADWDCFRTLTLREIWKIQNPLLEEHYVFSAATHLFQQVGCAKKQTSVSHSSTESEVVSLDTGLRLDGLPALELWDLIVSVFGNVSHVSDRAGQPVNGKNKSYNKIDVVHDIDLVPSNVQSASHEALMYVFEDNEAVIKMIMKGRSPTMRHVSRTQRVALDLLFDRINLDPKIQIKYIDTKNQLADILTKENFTRDEWNHLLTLFNISHFSSTACTAAMAKRAQQESGEERVTAKSRPMMNLTARTPSVVSSSTSSNPGRTSYGYQDPGKSIEVTTERGNLCNHYTQEDYGRSWSSPEWKSGAAEHDRSGKPETTSWDLLPKVVPHPEKPLLGGNAHSARYGEMNSRWIGET